MSDGTYLNLEEAVEQALRSGGPELLSNPRRLLAYLADALDPDGPELRVLIRCCDEGMLAPFAQADRMGPSDLQATAFRLQGYLTDECMVNEATASKVAGSFVVGVARWRGFAAAPRPVRGADAHASLELTAEQARRGGTFEVRWQAADGQVRTAPVQVPAGVRDGLVIRVPGQGEPGTGGGPSGDLVVVLRVAAPAPQPKKFPVWIAAIVALAVVGGLILLHPWGGGSKGGGSTGAASQGVEESGVWLVASSETVEKDGSVSDRGDREYDAHGNTVSWTLEWTDDDGETNTDAVTCGDYDEYGRTRSKHQTSKGDDYSGTYDYSYDYEVADDGRLLSSTEEYTSHYESGSGDDAYSSDDSWTTVRTYEYEGDELVSSDDVWSDEDGVKSETHVEYDEFGSQTSYHDVYHDGSFGDWVTDTTYEYERAADGTVLHEWQTRKRVVPVEIEVDTYEWVYDERYETEVDTYEWVYDERGNLTKSVHTEADGTVTTEEFESTLDDNGNLVERRNLTTGAVTTYKYVYIEDPSPLVKGDLKQ